MALKSLFLFSVPAVVMMFLFKNSTSGCIQYSIKGGLAASWVDVDMCGGLSETEGRDDGLDCSRR